MGAWALALTASNAGMYVLGTRATERSNPR